MGKKRKKKAHDVSKHCQDIWALACPWVEMLWATSSYIVDHMQCSLCTSVKGHPVAMRVKSYTLKKNARKQDICYTWMWKTFVFCVNKNLSLSQSCLYLQLLNLEPPHSSWEATFSSPVGCYFFGVHASVQWCMLVLFCACCNCLLCGYLTCWLLLQVHIKFKGDKLIRLFNLQEFSIFFSVVNPWWSKNIGMTCSLSSKCPPHLNFFLILKKVKNWGTTMVGWLWIIFMQK